MRPTQPEGVRASGGTASFGATGAARPWTASTRRQLCGMPRALQKAAMLTLAPRNDAALEGGPEARPDAVRTGRVHGVGRRAGVARPARRHGRP